MSVPVVCVYMRLKVAETIPETRLCRVRAAL